MLDEEKIKSSFKTCLGLYNHSPLRRAKRLFNSSMYSKVLILSAGSDHGNKALNSSISLSISSNSLSIIKPSFVLYRQA